MRRTPFWLIGLAALPMVGCLHTPMCWSPDGQWLAYTVAVRPRSEMLAPGWTFEKVTPGAFKAAVSATRSRPRERRLEKLTYRLWATRPETDESVLLDECAGPITSPGWSPDGLALAFGRLVPESDGRARFEIVVQDSPTHQRVLQSQQLAQVESDAEFLPASTVAWSPDGRLLAAPQFQPRGVMILRADNGRLVKSIEDAYMPAWSPDGSKLAYCHRGETDVLQCIDTNFGPARRLGEILKATQPPCWSRDSSSVVVARRKPQSGLGDPPWEQGELVRMRVDISKIEPLKLAMANPAGSGKKYRAVSFSFDRDGESLFCSTVSDDQAPHISWYIMSNGSVHKLFNPFDLSVPVGGLAVSPVDRKLALRVGPLDVAASPAVYDIDTGKLTPLVPDDDARMEWLGTIISAARTVLLTQVPPPVIGKQAVERPTLLPAPGEIPVQQETTIRLRRLARIGRPLCDRPTDSPADPALEEILDEARLFFDYLKQDYSAALESLEPVEARATSADLRGRLLYLRAQIFLGKGDTERAPETIAYLQSIQRGPVRSFEMTPVGPVLTTDSGSEDRWADFLALRSEAIKRMQLQSAEAPDPLANPNPGAADFGQGLDLPAGLFPGQPGELPRIRLPNQRLDVNELMPFLPQRLQEPPMDPRDRPMIPLLPRGQPRAQPPNPPQPRR